jgi:pyruvate formate lyase activating enzyme
VIITVDDQLVSVPGGTTIKSALENLGFNFSRYPSRGTIFAPCQTGGCYACNVLVNGELLPSCHTAVKSNQIIQTNISDEIKPLRIVGWYQTHAVGGVGTPWPSKAVSNLSISNAEVACFSAGCNLRCRTCQNSDVTYNSRNRAVTPEDAAKHLTLLREKSKLNRMAISGGEPTLNRPWLLGFFRALRSINPQGTRLHLDTNATILTPDYIDALVQAGVTDIGPDLKAVSLSTFQTITGIKDEDLANTYMNTEWAAINHIIDQYYPEEIFVGVGLPFNPAFYSSHEVMWAELSEWADRMNRMDNRVQVTILDYRPEFRRHDIQRPTPEEMNRVKEFLEGTGLQTVTAQTIGGHLPPKKCAPDLRD